MDNPIQTWIENDEKLSLVITEIHHSNLTIDEQAEMAFHKLSELYNLPKLPEDADEIEEITEQEAISVYQELGLVKFLEPSGDLRGLVLVAVYNVLNKITINLDEVYKKARVKTTKGICYMGENAKVTIKFLKENENWVDCGCRLYLK